VKQFNLWTRARLALILIALAVMCASAMAQENTADGWYKKGSDVMGKVPWEDVIKMYNKAIELSPNNATYWSAKGSAFSFLALGTNNLSYYNESLEAYNKAIEIDPGNPWTWDRIGSTFLQLKRYNESLEARDRAIENVNTYQGYLPVSKVEMLSSIWAGKAVTLQEAGRMEESIAAFDKALQINPGNYEAYMMKGRALKVMDKYSEPARTYEVGDSRHPGVPKQENASTAAEENTTEYWVTKAKDLRINGSTEEAISAYDRALQIDPGNETVWAYKALELQVSGREDESSKAYEKALSILDEKLKRNPEDAEAWMRKGRALSSLGRQNESNQAHEKALQIYHQRVQEDPKNATAWRYMAEVLMNLRRGGLVGSSLIPWP